MIINTDTQSIGTPADMSTDKPLRINDLSKSVDDLDRIKTDFRRFGGPKRLLNRICDSVRSSFGRKKRITSAFNAHDAKIKAYAHSDIYQLFPNKTKSEIDKLIKLHNGDKACAINFVFSLGLDHCLHRNNSSLSTYYQEFHI